MTRRLTPETDYGTYRCGDRNRNAKLTEDEVRLIRTLLRFGNLQRTIAEVFGVSQNTVSRIGNGTSWKWLT
ncbi:MAG: hypothetical protein ABID54_00330 [Pseudomonadota bacterium]